MGLDPGSLLALLPLTVSSFKVSRGGELLRGVAHADATASALMTSILNVSLGGYGWLSQGIVLRFLLL